MYKPVNMYVVTFHTMKGGMRCWVINLEAHNQKEARKQLEEAWELHDSTGAHMFRIKIRRLKDNEEYLYNWFKRIDRDQYYKLNEA